MKILLIANYVSLPWEIGNCRFIYLINQLCNYNDVELITTSFNHNMKKHRMVLPEMEKKCRYKITLIDEPGYKKNVSLKRIYSHKYLSICLKKYLHKLEYKPDVIYCSIPSLDLAYEAVKYANKNNIRFIIDIQDLWPEAFKMVFNIPIISDLLFYPMLKKANYVYSHSNEIVAVSQTYVNRALSVNKNIHNGLSVYLGTDLNYFDECSKNNKKEFNDNITRVVYIGTLGTSYDIKSVVDAIKILNNKGINSIEFIVIGDGPLKNDYENYAKKVGINCTFTGRLDYPEMVGFLCSCNIAINPIVGTSVASIINKVGDYAAAGIAVINTQNSKEYISLLKKYKAGLNCNSNDSCVIADKIEYLINNKKKCIQFGVGNRRMAEELFDRNKTYSGIINLIIGKK